MLALLLLLAFDTVTLRVGSESQVFEISSQSQSVPVWWQWDEDMRALGWTAAALSTEIPSPPFPDGCEVVRWQQRDWIAGAEALTEHWYLSCRVPMVWGILSDFLPGPEVGQEGSFAGYCQVPANFVSTRCIGPILPPPGMTVNAVWGMSTGVSVRVMP